LVNHSNLYHLMRNDHRLLTDFIKRMAHVL
jgi:hypothetical protein